MASLLSSSCQESFDYVFKLLLIGDSGVGKSSLLLRFTSGMFDDLPPTVGIDFRLRKMTLGGSRIKLAIWDTAGQERFRTMTSAYYRGAHGVILVYDVTRRETFTNLSDVWLKELDLHTTYQDCVKMVVGNKVDKEKERVVSKEEGIQFSREHNCIYLECSAKTSRNVGHCFEELALKIMQTPSLLRDNARGTKGIAYKHETTQDTCSYC